MTFGVSPLPGGIGFWGMVVATSPFTECVGLSRELRIQQVSVMKPL